MGLSYHYASATTPMWLEALLYATPAVLMLAALVLLLSGKTRGDVFILLMSVAAIMLGMQWVYNVDGYTRLLAAPQAVVWTLLALYLAHRLSDASLRTPQRWAMVALLSVFSVNLAFDYTDLVRYARGDKTPEAYVVQKAQLAAPLPFAKPMAARPASYY